MTKPANQGHLCAFLIVAVASSGCAHRNDLPFVDRCTDIPPGAIPEPAGNKICNWETMQVAGAAADQSVLYRADFIASSTDLSPAARARMGRLTHSNSANCLQWVVEPTGDLALDDARVESVIHELSLLGATPIDVTVATPAAIGLTGPQAERIASGLGSSNTRSNSNVRTNGQFGSFGFGGFGGFRGL